MKSRFKLWSAFALIGVFGTILVLGGKSEATAQRGNGDGHTVIVSEPSVPSVSPAARDLPVGMPATLQREINPLRNPSQFEEGMGQKGTHTNIQDPLADLNNVDTGETPGLLFDFAGMGDFNQYTPPDTNGDVGPNHYVQMVNVSFAIYDKSGTLVDGPHPYNTLFVGAGGVCESNNDGDPVVLYDELADRWMLVQFADLFGSNTMCIAISTTPDPTDTYYRYQFALPDVPDYMKLGVWPDGYYMGTNSGFPNAYYAHVFDRVKMLAGLTATSQSIGGYPNFMMPADLDGPTAPPAGSPNYFYTFLKQGYANHPPGVDRIEVYEFDVDWATPGNTTFTNTDTLPIAAFNYTVCGFFVQNCIPQPGTGQTIDSLSYWPMFRLQYRNFGIRETLVGNFTVDLDGANKAAIRWFELRNSPSGWDLYQEGTLAPDSDHRWMGSIAMDGSGNIALGYSVSSSTTKPAIRYATRNDSDPLGTFQAEASIIEGTGVQTGQVRWGDYSAMSVDPADQCTFWYTTEYHDVNDTGFSWNTRVGVFKEPNCTGFLGPDYVLAVTPAAQTVCAPANAAYAVNVTSVLGFVSPVTLSASGNPAGTSTNFSVNPVTPTGSSTFTIGNTGAASAGSYDVNVIGVALTKTHTSTVTFDLFTASPGAPSLTSPANGATGVSYTPTFQWSAASQASAYDLEVATDSGFTNIIYATTVSGTSHKIALSLSSLTTYYWRVSADNTCGGGSNSATFSFTVQDIPPILIVDDDGTASTILATYTDALDALGLNYDVWDTTASDTEPTTSDLAPYKAVIWFTGVLFGSPGAGPAGPSASTETALGSWLDDGGCFFISAQDYHYDKGQTAFMTNYLGAGSITDDTNAYSDVTGQGVFGGVGPSNLTYPFTEYSDTINTLSAGGMNAMKGGTSIRAGTSMETADFKATYWVFPWEALPQADRESTMQLFVDWCDFSGPVIYLPLIMNLP